MELNFNLSSGKCKVFLGNIYLLSYWIHTLTVIISFVVCLIICNHYWEYNIMISVHHFRHQGSPNSCYSYYFNFIRLGHVPCSLSSRKSSACNFTFLERTDELLERVASIFHSTDRVPHKIELVCLFLRFPKIWSVLFQCNNVAPVRG